ncbi:MAG: methylated-DNA--[protein]-cysteine S-methyltransferase [Alphaproteobacteria bacterium]|nr:methylated-DNA--[protein]-cysteine S-methyltransferase [Alphaproteobacteria bacterium]
MTVQTFTHARFASPLGDLHLVLDGAALVALDYPGYEPRMLRLLARRFAGARLAEGAAPAAVADALARYFAGDGGALGGLDLRLGGTPFQRSVWQALREIPWGETMSYGGLAASIGRPAAVRAVGLANGANPVAIVVPCHRVIGAKGALTGYAGGLERKAWLLRHEGAAAQLPAVSADGAGETTLAA